MNFAREENSLPSCGALDDVQKDRGKRSKVSRLGHTFTLAPARELILPTSALLRGAFCPTPVPALQAFLAPWAPASYLALVSLSPLGPLPYPTLICVPNSLFPPGLSQFFSPRTQGLLQPVSPSVCSGGLGPPSPRRPDTLCPFCVPSPNLPSFPSLHRLETGH